jgi:hypothetical protein
MNQEAKSFLRSIELSKETVSKSIYSYIFKMVSMFFFNSFISVSKSLSLNDNDSFNLKIGKSRSYLDKPSNEIFGKYKVFFQLSIFHAEKAF